MSAEWDRGVLNESSWHGMEIVGVMETADDMIEHGEDSDAWPLDLEKVALQTVDGLETAFQGIKATYRHRAPIVQGVVGDYYRQTLPSEWRDLIKLAVTAGAKPTGAFSLRGGRKVLATFEVGESNGIKTQLVIVDSFDGSSRLLCGFTSIRVVCANTLAAAFRADGKSWARITHTASAEEKIEKLGQSITAAIEEGQKVRDVYERATQTAITAAQRDAIFDLLFPEADEEATKRQRTAAEKRREEGRAAMATDVNRENDGMNVATVWNAATYLVDREADGTARNIRGGDKLNSMLFGSRGKRVAEIQEIVEVVMADGTLEQMTVTQAQEHGLDDSQLGQSILADMLDDN